MVFGPAAVEHIAHHRHLAGGAEAFDHVLHGNGRTHPVRLKRSAEVPEIQRGIELTLQRLLCKQRRCAVHDRRRGLEIDAGA